MGLEIEQEKFQEADYRAYSERLYQCLDVLKVLVDDPGFGQGDKKIGAELENYIVDEQGEVLPLNQEIINSANNKQFTVELNKFNLEINFKPVALGTHAFSELQAEMDLSLGQLRRVARELNAQIIPTGILPTLKDEHLKKTFMTDCTRYHALSKSLLAMRGEDFKVHITGDDELFLTRDHVALEGANTSFQFHLMFDHHDFANVFNATQLITPLVVAIAANSPVLLNKVLWDETRIALFKQSIDSRLRHSVEWRQPSRVSFGHGWVRDDAWELFAESVALYPPLFPIVSKHDPAQQLENGETPALDELNLHMGTTWPWNRPVYCSEGDGHIRIEMRALPAGPTNKDMCANAAFATGLAMGLKDNIRDFLAVMPFRFAEYNFYRAAQNGLDANIVWTDLKRHQAIEMSIMDVLYAMMPIAEQGLAELGIADQEIQYYLQIIERRLERKITGARWQKKLLKKLEQKSSREEACRDMFQKYAQQQMSNLPVSEWED